MAVLADHIITTYPQHYRLFSQREFTWNRVRQQNRNPLLTMDIGADGLKTGNIEESGFGLVGSAVQNGQRLIVVVNGLKTARDRAQEARKLLEWGFRTFEAREIFAAGEIVGEVALFGGAKASVAVTAKGPVKLLLPRGSSDRVRGSIIYRGPVRAPVARAPRSAPQDRAWRKPARSICRFTPRGVGGWLFDPARHGCRLRISTGWIAACSRDPRRDPGCRYARPREPRRRFHGRASSRSKAGRAQASPPCPRVAGAACWRAASTASWTQGSWRIARRRSLSARLSRRRHSAVRSLCRGADVSMPRASTTSTTHPAALKRGQWSDQ